jgi:hypothetical protein
MKLGGGGGDTSYGDTWPPISNKTVRWIFVKLGITALYKIVEKV